MDSSNICTICEACDMRKLHPFKPICDNRESLNYGQVCPYPLTGEDCEDAV